MYMQMFVYTVNPRISSLGGLFIFWTFAWGIFRRGSLYEGSYKSFLIIGHIPVDIVLLVNYFFDATYTSNRVLLKGTGEFSFINDCFSFLAL